MNITTYKSIMQSNPALKALSPHARANALHITVRTLQRIENPNWKPLDEYAHDLERENSRLKKIIDLAIDTPKNKAVSYVQNLDNYTDAEQNALSQEEQEMAKGRIRRQVLINGKLQWVTGATEQDYVNNVIKAIGGVNQSKSDIEKHNACEYCWNHYNVFMKNSLETVTRGNYERQLKLHICPVLEGKYMEDLTPQDMMAIFDGMDNHDAKVTLETKHKVKTVLNPIMEAAVEDGILSANPLKSRKVKIKGEPSNETEPYSVEQMKMLVGSICSVKKPYDKNYLALQTVHPLSLEEVLGLRWQDIDLENNLLHIRNTVTHPTRNQPVFKEKCKTDKRRRTLALVEEIKPYLAVGRPDEFVVGGIKAVSYQQVVRMCERIQKNTSFTEKITPRRFRTTVLTDIYDQNGNLKEMQEAAGHATPAMGLKHYAKNRAKKESAAKAIAKAYGLAT